jgi:transcriptional regulator with XRE-family HTH domain
MQTINYKSFATAMRELLVDAIDKQGTTKNEVARLTGLTPTTIIRIYNGESGRLHPRTVTRIAESLRYKATFGGKDKVFIEPRKQSKGAVLTPRQREKILREVTDALRKALAEL